MKQYGDIIVVLTEIVAIHKNAVSYYEYNSNTLHKHRVYLRSGSVLEIEGDAIIKDWLAAYVCSVWS